MKILKWSLMGATALFAVSNSVVADDIADAVRQAIASHPKFSAEKAGRDATASRVDVAKAAGKPKITLSGGIGREWSENAKTRSDVLFGGSKNTILTRKESNLIISQSIFNGHQNSANVKIAKSNLESAEAQLIVARERLAIEVVEAYLELYRAQQVVILAEQNVEHQENMLRDIQDKAESGTGNSADVSLARGRVALAKSVLQRVKGDRTQAEINYKEIVGVDGGVLQKPILVTGMLPESREVALDMALDTHPALKAAGAEIDASKAAVKASKAGTKPKIWADIGVGYNEDVDGTAENSQDIYGMLRMSIDLYDGGATKGRVAEARNTLQRTGYLLEDLERTIEKNVYGTWAGYETQKSRVVTLNEHAQSAKEVFDAYKQQFSLGRRTLLDLMNASSEAFDARVNKVNGDIGLIFSQYRIFAAMGNVTDKL